MSEAQSVKRIEPVGCEVVHSKSCMRPSISARVRNTSFVARPIRDATRTPSLGSDGIDHNVVALRRLFDGELGEVVHVNRLEPVVAIAEDTENREPA